MNEIQMAREAALRVARDVLPPDRDVSDLIDTAEWILNGLPEDKPEAGA